MCLAYFLFSTFADASICTDSLTSPRLSILGPEYVEEQHVGGPTHEPRRHREGESNVTEHTKLEREVQLAHHFEHAAEGETPAQSVPPPLTPAEALRLKGSYLNSITVLSKQFGARVVDVSEHSVIVELSGKTSRVEAYLNLLKPYGVLESARTGNVVRDRFACAILFILRQV